MNSNLIDKKIPVVDWTETGENCRKMTIMRSVIRKDYKLIVSTDMTIDENKLHAFIFYYKRSKDKIDAVVVGKVREVGVILDTKGPVAYEFSVETTINIDSDIELDSIIYRRIDDEPEFVILKKKPLKKSKKKNSKRQVVKAGETIWDEINSAR